MVFEWFGFCVNSLVLCVLAVLIVLLFGGFSCLFDGFIADLFAGDVVSGGVSFCLICFLLCVCMFVSCLLVFGILDCCYNNVVV